MGTPQFRAPHALSSALTALGTQYPLDSGSNYYSVILLLNSHFTQFAIVA